ncbi:MAG: alpha/beta fold hydrolase [Clostridiales Family XIII bacterium]|jgi:uncharacterized membrane protein/pimeloyl-ACP methyl ester carboxylesterase|nr:alpha/beta fold hydrolase [Clostridiales Family XIII bacterium]
MGAFNVFLFVTNICVVLLCGALLPIMPMLTRKSFLFGVKVPPEAQNTDEAKALKRNYVAVATTGGLIVLAASVWQYTAAPNYTIFAVMFSPFALIAVQFAAFVPNHGKALRLKTRLGWSVAEIKYADTKTSFTRGNLSAMPHFWYVTALIIAFASFAVALARYPALPDPIPTHWDLNMAPDAWSSKSLGTVLLMPLFNIVTVAIMWLTGALIERAKLQIDHKEPSKSFAQHKKYRRLMGHGIGILAVALAAMFLILGLQTVFVGFTASIGLILGIVIAPSILVCAIAVRAGQGGTLLKVNATEITAAANGDTASSSVMSDDKYWVWGLFYHNPEDPACFVGNRFGGNIGFNYARPAVKIGAAIGIAAIAACYVWVKDVPLNVRFPVETAVTVGAEFPLDGILTLPGGDGKVPAVVLVHGSGPSDKDESAYGIKAFKDISDFLVANGIAVLRYDKRTYAHAAKLSQDIAAITAESETIEDAILAGQLLARDERIDSAKIFVVGHSLGGMLAPRIVDESNGVFAGAVIMAGSPRSFLDIIYDQNMYFISLADPSERDALIKKVEDAKPYYGMPQAYIDEMDAHPVKEYLLSTDKPFLILQGGKDFQVSPDKDFEEYKRLAGGRSNFEFRLYGNLTHFFTVSTVKPPTTEDYIAGAHVDTAPLADIVRWIQERY